MAQTMLVSKIRELFEKPIPGLCLAIIVGVPASVIIAMRHDARWLLVVPWVCLVVIAWEAARVFKFSRGTAALTAALTSIPAATMFFALYAALVPDSPASLPASNTVAPPLDNSMSFSCTNIRPPVLQLRADRVTHIAYIAAIPGQTPEFLGAENGVGIGGFFPAAGLGNASRTLDTERYGEVAKCTLQNLSDFSIAEAKVRFVVELFSFPVTLIGKIGRGEPLSSREIEFPYMQAAKGTSDYFYISNLSKLIAAVTPSKTISAVRVGRDVSETVNLIEDRFQPTGVILMPRDAPPTNPPAAPPPSPAQPPRPAGTSPQTFP